MKIFGVETPSTSGASGRRGFLYVDRSKEEFRSALEYLNNVVVPRFEDEVIVEGQVD